MSGRPVGYVVIRRRGGWNAKPEVVRFYESEANARSAATFPEMGVYDPPADETDVFTYHEVLPSKWPVSRPEEVRPRSHEPRRNPKDLPVFRGVPLGRLELLRGDGGRREEL